MSIFLIACIAIALAVLLLVVSKEIAFKRIIKKVEKQHDEVTEIKLPQGSKLSGLKPVKYNGKLPEKVDNFVLPRYVYENLAESESFDPSQGQIIGYRISPTLVIHDMVGSMEGWSEYDTTEFAKKYNGHLLSWHEAQVLLAYWKHVSQMRQDAGDTPLPEGMFWIEKYKQMASPSSKKSRSLFANIIMRR